VPDVNDDQPPAGRSPFSLSTLAGLGLANAISVGVGLALGHYLDGRFDTAPVFVLIGLASGLVLGAVGSFKEIRRYLQD
jgi:ATP synthase protein I